MNNLILFIKGIIMGVANIIPGVSGGTLAVVLNIFDQLIFSINNLFKDFKRNFSFLLVLILGMGFGILLFSSLIDWGLTNHSFTTNMFFIGLIVGSFPLIYSKAINSSKGKKNYLYALISFLFIFYMSTLTEPETLNNDTFTSSTYILLFLGGAVAAGAMIIPGISGSFLLMLMGIYTTIIGSISELTDYLKSPSNFNLLFSALKVVVPTGFGIIFGIFIIGRLISVALEKAQSQTYFVVLGLILGSIYSIFSSPTTYATGFDLVGIISGAVLFFIGLIIALKLGE